jgi:hypothetical protein
MALFNIYTGNHSKSARISVQDHVLWIKGGLTSLGHTVTVSDSDMPRSAMNIIFDWFLPPLAESLRSSGVDYIVVMTEHADGAGFNNRRDSAWTLRWREFVRASHGARGIWSLFEGNEAQVAHLAPAAYLELGYEPTMEPAKRHSNIEAEVMFYGSIDDRRKETINALSRRGMRVLYNQNIINNDLLAHHLQSAHLIIDPRGPNLIPIPSVARVGRAMHLPRPIAVERTPQNQGLGRYAHVSPKEGAEAFADFCEGLLVNRINLQLGAEETLERIKTAVPMARCMERALDQTVGQRSTWNRARVRPTIPIIRFVADLTGRPGMVDFFMEKTLPSLLTPGNLAGIAGRADCTIDIFAPEDEVWKLEGAPIADLFAYAQPRTRAVPQSVRGPAPIETVDGLDDDPSRATIHFLREHAGSDVWLIDAGNWRIFSDGALASMLDEILAWAKRPSAPKLSHVVAPILLAENGDLPDWPAYRQWGDLNAEHQAPNVPNSPAALIAAAAPNQRPVLASGFLVEPVDVATTLLLPLFPSALAVNARSLRRGGLRAAWRPSFVDAACGTAMITQAKQGLVLEVKQHLAGADCLSHPLGIARLIQGYEASGMAEIRAAALRRFTSATPYTILVDAGEVNALALAAAEERLDLRREALRAALGFGDIAPRRPAISPAAEAQPLAAVGD